MKLFPKLSLNPEDPSAVLRAIEHALEIGLWLKPKDLLPYHIQELVREVDHIGFAAGVQTIPAILQYQKDHGYSLRTFNSTIASKEFGNVITIYELKGGSLPLEILMLMDNSKGYPQHHIAFSTNHEENLSKIISSFNEPVRLPSFMKGTMKNEQENVSIIYLDGGAVRFEFIYKKNSQ